MGDATPKQETLNLIKAHSRILVIPARPDGDSISSALALMLVLKKLGKEVTVATLDRIPEQLSFLPAISEIKSDLSALSDFVITVDCNTVQPKKLSHTYENGKLSIFITPKGGQFGPEMVSFSQGSLHADLVITVDAPNYEMLGSVYEKHPDLFQGRPVINIDHHASNNFFGTVNLVDVAAAATTEVLVGLIEALSQENGNLMDADIATCLLTGLLDDTGSFQHQNTTPKALTIGAQLVAAGADKARIVKELFKTYPLQLLHLWGRALERVREDRELKFVWSYLSHEDFQATGLDSSAGLVDKLMTGVPDAEIVIMLSEKEPRVVYGSIRTTGGVDSAAIAGLFGGGGHSGAAGFKLEDIAINEALDLVFDKVKAFRGPQAPTSPIENQTLSHLE